MKKLIATLLLSTLSFASLPEGEFRNLNANYESPKGLATADYLNIDGFGTYRNPTLDVENKDGLLVFGFEGKQFEIDLSLFAVRDADYINVGEMNFSNSQSGIDLNFYTLNASSVGYSTDIQKGSADCKRTRTYTDPSDDLIMNCLENSKLSVYNFSFVSDNSSFKNIVDGESLMTSQIILNDIQMTINRGYVYGSFSSNLSFGVSINFSGNIDYQKENEMIVVEVEDVRAGFFSIRTKLFQELAANAPDNFLVDEPYIYIDLRK